MSPLVRSFLGGILGLVFILFIQGYLVRNANKNKQGKRLTLFDVIVTSEDNRYSLSRFQIYIWTVWVAIAFVAAVFYEGYLPDIPENLGILMGINGLTTVLASALPKKTDSQEKPSFYSDIFLDRNGSLDLPRTQMFIWTIIILATHIFVTVKQFTIPGTEKLISDVPAGLLILMGVSNGAYLGMKAADAKAEAPSINPDQNAG